MLSSPQRDDRTLLLFSLMDAGYAMPVGVLSLLHGDEADDVEQDQVDYDLDMRWG